MSPVVTAVIAGLGARGYATALVRCLTCWTMRWPKRDDFKLRVSWLRLQLQTEMYVVCAYAAV